MTTCRIEVSGFVLMAHAVADHGAPCLPFDWREGQPAPVTWPDAGMPCRLSVQWRASNDIHHLRVTRPTHGGYPDEPTAQ